MRLSEPQGGRVFGEKNLIMSPVVAKAKKKKKKELMFRVSASLEVVTPAGQNSKLTITMTDDCAVTAVRND